MRAGTFPVVAEIKGWGSYLRKAMAAKGLGAADLARATGVNQSLISRWLKDEIAPSVENLRRVSKALGIPLLDLLVAAGHVEPGEARMRDRPEPPAAPIGAGVDPDLLAALASADPAAIEAVRAVLRATKRNDS